jgi:UDP-glucose 4-epimerase
MRVAVTGGSGFIGAHVVDELCRAGHDAIVLDRIPPHRADVRFRPIDITDLASVERGVRGCDVVFHLAAIADVNVAFQHPAETVAVNVGGAANVWEASRRCGVGRVVLASTVWVYGATTGPEPLTEDALIDPAKAGHVYTSTKIAAELVAQSYFQLYGVPFTILRYGIPFGPGMRDELVIARFTRLALDGHVITVQGDGAQCRNYLYVEDLAAAHVLALGDVAENQVFNLEGLTPISVRRIVETLRAELPGDVAVEYVPARAGDFSGRAVSAEKAARVLGWTATTSFEEGVRRYLAGLEETPTTVAAGS